MSYILSHKTSHKPSSTLCKSPSIPYTTQRRGIYHFRMRVPSQDRVIQFSLKTYDPDVAREIAAKLAHDMKRTNKPIVGNSNNSSGNGSDDLNNPPYDANDPVAIMKEWMKKTYTIRYSGGREERENKRLAKIAKRLQNQNELQQIRPMGKTSLPPLKSRLPKKILFLIS